MSILDHNDNDNLHVYLPIDLSIHPPISACLAVPLITPRLTEYQEITSGDQVKVNALPSQITLTSFTCYSRCARLRLNLIAININSKFEINDTLFTP